MLAAAELGCTRARATGLIGYSQVDRAGRVNLALGATILIVTTRGKIGRVEARSGVRAMPRSRRVRPCR